jgi:serine/threonine protein kinase
MRPDGLRALDLKGGDGQVATDRFSTPDAHTPQASSLLTPGGSDSDLDFEEMTFGSPTGGAAGGVLSDFGSSTSAEQLGAGAEAVVLEDEHLSPTAQGCTTISDFEVLNLVGQGGFGKVMQVRKRDSGQIFALKSMLKAHIVQCEEVDGVRTERRVLQQVRHPFIVRLHYAFQTQHRLFLVMDYVNGGQIFYHLREAGLFQEPQARFYAAELFLALNFLHARNIVHRDLKPENLLLDAEGHLILTDFGCAKEGIGPNADKFAPHDPAQKLAPLSSRASVQGLATSCTGTEAYMAPEIIKLLAIKDEVRLSICSCLRLLPVYFLRLTVHVGCRSRAPW